MSGHASIYYDETQCCAFVHNLLIELSFHHIDWKVNNLMNEQKHFNTRTAWQATKAAKKILSKSNLNVLHLPDGAVQL